MDSNVASLALEENMSRSLRWLLAVFMATMGASCTVDNADAPELMGPSATGHSIELRAIPDQLIADGWSSSIIEAILRGPNSERLSGQTVYFDIEGFVDKGNLAPLNGPRPTYGGVEATAVSATTDGNGVARARYWAPFRTDQPGDSTVVILAREESTNFRQALFAAGRTQIFLRAADRPLPSPFPTPQPGCTAPTAMVELSGLCKGGEIKAGKEILALGGGSGAGGDTDTIAVYIFNWGDGTETSTGSSTASHTYGGNLAGFAVKVQLTVINSCGASASSSEEAEVVLACPP